MTPTAPTVATATFRPWYEPEPGPDVRVRVDHRALTTATQGLLEQAGLDADDAATAAEVVVAADLRGVASHGVSNMLGSYLEWLESGRADASAKPVVVRDAPAAVVFDGRRALGVAVAPMAMRAAIDRAERCGIGMASMGNSTHLGMAGFHAALAVQRDQIGLCTTSTAAASAFPTFGSEPMLGTNPIAVAAPTGRQAAFVFDAATTVVAGNRIASAGRDGIQIPPGILGAADGVPRDQPSDAPDDWRCLLPLGSTPELSSHKGYGLAVVVEILGRVLSLQPTYPDRGRGTACHFFAAISLDLVSEPDRFKAAMDDLIETLNGVPSNTPGTSVLVAGQRAAAAEATHRVSGVPLHPAVLEWIAERCARAGVPCPEALP